MRCISQMKGGVYGCGQCLPCRINKRREWASRIMLESKAHAKSCFVTLTYDDKHLPFTIEGRPTLRPEDVTLWLKRFRKSLCGRPIRYFLVGEYGDTTQRPHYHLVMFNVDKDDLPKIRATWNLGSRVEVEDLLPERAQYAAGYTTKKMTKKDDPRLDGRYPEYARMSLKNGGIGATYLPVIESVLLTNEYAKQTLAVEGDVPASLKGSGRSLPLGRYLRSKLREKILPNQTSFQRDWLRREKDAAQMQLVREGSLTLEEFFRQKGFVSGENRDEKVDQMALNLKARSTLRRRKI